MPVRSREALKTADILVFESERGGRAALKGAGIHRPFDVLSEHREAATLDAVHEALIQGKTVCYMSDQGMPTVADPGKDLTRIAASLKAKIRVIPGPSSITTALSAWPKALNRFHYTGFFPADKDERRSAIARAASLDVPQVIMDTPYRLQSVVDDCAAGFGIDRFALIALEMGTDREDFMMGSLGDLKTEIESIAHTKPLFVLVVDGIRGVARPPQAQRPAARNTGNRGTGWVKGRGNKVKR